MSEPAISVKELSKCYRLGAINRHTLVEEAQYFWHKLRGRNPANVMTQLGHSATEARQVNARDEGASEFWALRDVTFDIKPGEVVGFIGRNGAGKSTLLKLLTRITEPTSGEAVINGRVASLLEVGTGFHPDLTGRENVYMNGTILGMKRAEIDRNFDAIVNFAELEKFIDTPVKRYSSGMYVRLAFAVAAHLDPDILLVDEVLAVGDAAFQRRCLGRMSEIAKAGRTVLFVSHNMAAVSNLCSRVLLLNGGLIEKDGGGRDVVQHYVASSTIVTNAMSLAERIDRVGDGRIRFICVEWLREDGQAVSALQSGGRYRMVLHYRTDGAEDYNNVSVNFMIKDMTDVCVMLHQTRFNNQEFSNISSRGCFVCVMPKWPLVEGMYKLTLFVGINNQPCDVVEDAVRIKVEAGDFYGTGHRGRPNLCKTLVECDWSCKEERLNFQR